ncbi:MAG: hypothetical protein NTX11_00300 [Candidatus Saccharibacteria bacterium]|nr:hypothetical protein [Candidatus Saccharibacteria bacterium]
MALGPFMVRLTSRSVIKAGATSSPIFTIASAESLSFVEKTFNNSMTVAPANVVKTLPAHKAMNTMAAFERNKLIKTAGTPAIRPITISGFIPL